MNRPVAAVDPARVWRDHSGFIAWPTVALSVVVFALWTGNLVAHARGWLPGWLALPVGTLLVYLSFTPLHEATHGNVGGSPAAAWLDEAVGWLAGLPLLAPYPAVKAIHLQHHGHTNDPQEDPDAFIHGTGWTMVRGALLMWVHYVATFLTRMQRTHAYAQRTRGVVVGALVAEVVLLLAATAAGHGGTVLLAVVLPAWLGVAWLAVVFDWLPHLPHDRTERFLDTRAIEDRWLDTLLLGQNLHLVHHLWPRVPFYRYRAVFDASRPLLEERGSPIVRARDALTALRAGR